MGESGARDVGALFAACTEQLDQLVVEVLQRDLPRGSDLHALHLSQGLLRESGEPAQRLHLDVEHVDAHRVVGGRRVHVEDAAAHRELAAVVDLTDALVSGLHEVCGELFEIDQVTDRELQRFGTQRRVGHFLRQCGRRDDDYGRVRTTRARGGVPLG